MRRLLYTFLAALPLGLAVPGLGLAATAPPQAKTGPGGLGNISADVVKRALGRASSATYLYHLADNPTAPRPVVVLFHAWGAVDPVIYGGWIDHLARQGYLVLVPGFQTVGKTRAPEATEVAAGLLKDAFATLAQDRDARPDLARVAYLGHSAGAAIAMNLAAGARTTGLPAPKLVYAIMPGGVASDEKARGVLLADLSAIDPATTVVTMVGDREFQAADRISRRFLRETTAVPQNRKLFLRAASDDHGFPSLSATLASPASPKEGYEAGAIKLQPDPPVDPKAPRQPRPRFTPDMVLSGEQTVLLGQLQRNVTDAIDWAAYWRTFDVVATAAFAGVDMTGVKADPTFVDMGRWSDGWPVRRLSAEIPRAVDPAAVPVARAAPAPTKQPVLRQRRTRTAR